MARVSLLLPLIYLLSFLQTGCHRSPTTVAPAELPVIPISKPVQRQITNFADFTGRTEAVQAVDIRPRVTGYLTQIPFQEGAMVKAGDLLFVIDPRPYRALFEQAKGQISIYDAQYKQATLVYQRDLAINARVATSISQEVIDQDRAAMQEAQARLQAYEKNTETHRLNVEFTHVTSPIDGQISRYYLTLGNLVNQDQTLLTTVVSVDPMYAFFDMDEPTLLSVRRAINEGKIKKSDGKLAIPVFLRLQGEEGYPHAGIVNFVDNQVNPTTGSISVRGVFPNPMPEHGVRLLSPGMFVRIRLPIGQPHNATLIIDRAIGSDQGLKYVYVVDANSEVQYRRIVIGPLQDDGLRVILDGLKPDEWVVIGGLQQVRPRMKIQVERTSMPSLGHPSEPETQPAKAPEPTPQPTATKPR